MRERSTPDRLIDAAEELLTTRSPREVTVAEITTLAGQRNRSALQYHFGSKEQLLEALLGRHRATLTERRAALINELDAEGVEDPSLRLARGIVVPLSTFVNGSIGERAYLKVADDHFRRRLPRVAHPPAVAEPMVWQLGAAYCGDPGEPDWSHRAHRALQMAFVVIAMLSERVSSDQDSGAKLLDFDAFVADTVEVAHAFLVAGVTQARPAA